MTPATLVSGALAALCAGLLLTALELGASARRVPLVILVPTMLLLLLQLLRDLGVFAGDGAGRAKAWLGYRSPPQGLEAVSTERREPARELMAVALVAGVVLSIDLLGLPLALPLWLCLVLVVRARVRLAYAALAAGMTFVAIEIGLVHTLGTLLPNGRLLDWLGL